jgi:hypothetical protein
MYTNKFKGSTNISTTVVLSVLVAAVHVLGYEVLTANDDVTPSEIAASVATTPIVEATKIDTIVVTATRLRSTK